MTSSSVPKECGDNSQLPTQVINTMPPSESMLTQANDAKVSTPAMNEPSHAMRRKKWPKRKPRGHHGGEQQQSSKTDDQKQDAKESLTEVKAPSKATHDDRLAGVDPKPISDEADELTVLRAESKAKNFEIARLKQLNWDMKCKLVELQPKPHASDGEIAAKYRDLCTTLEQWIQINCSDLHDMTSRIESGSWNTVSKRLLPKLLDHVEPETAVEYPAASMSILTSLTTRFLVESFLTNDEWLPGSFTNDKTEMLDKMLQSMKPNGHDFAEQWRSTTYAALTGLAEFKKAHAAALNDCNRKLYNLIEPFADDARKMDRPSIREIVKSFSEFGIKVRMCPFKYDFDHIIRQADPIEERELSMRSMSEYDLVNVEDGLTFSSTRLAGLSNGTETGEMVCAVFPALTKTSNRHNRAVIVKATILAKIVAHKQYSTALTDDIKLNNQQPQRGKRRPAETQSKSSTSGVSLVEPITPNKPRALSYAAAAATGTP